MNAKTAKKETELDRAIRKGGSVTGLAEAIGVPQNVVSGWKTRGVSKDGALKIEQRWPRAFKAVRLVGVKAELCFERTTPKPASKRARARA